MPKPALPDAFLRVYLVRHGESTNNVLLAQSWDAFATHRVPDSPLTPLGHGQATALGASLAAAQDAHALRPRLTAVYASPMVRALETGSYLANSLGHPLLVWPELHGGWGRGREWGARAVLYAFVVAHPPSLPSQKSAGCTRSRPPSRTPAFPRSS